MVFIADDDAVEQIAASGTDKALSVTIQPGLASRPIELDADIGDEIADGRREEGIGVADEASALAGVVREGLAELLQDPGAGRPGGHGEVANLSVLVIKDEEDVVPPKEDVVDGEEIHRRKFGDVISEKRRPTLVRVRLGPPRSEPREVAGDGGLADVEVQPEEFAVDTRSAPCLVLTVQALDGLADLDRNRRRGASFGLATPECSEPASMPLEDGFRRHDRQGIAPARPPLAEGDLEEVIGVSDRGVWIVGFVHRELLAEGHVFKNELVVRVERGHDQTAYDEQEVWHRHRNGGGDEGTAKETNLLSCGERPRSHLNLGNRSVTPG